MDALQLSQEIQDAVAQEFPDWQPGDEAVYPSKYFDHGVFFTMPDGEIQDRHPRYCATDYGAARLADVLTSSGRLHMTCASGKTDYALPGVADNKTVPYLQFATDTDPDAGPFTGPLSNAGLLLDYFNHGYPPVRALNSCQADVTRAFGDAGLIPPPSQADIDAIMAQTS